MKISDVCCVLHDIAPLHLAQSWDNVGLLAGDEQADCKSILLTIDLTHAVLDEAVKQQHDLVLAYHPPLFKAVSSLRAQSCDTDAIVWRAIRSGIAIYSMHTALDAADGGTNDVLAEICGATNLQPFEYVNGANHECKIVVFVPEANVDALADAMSIAGAGVIGEYEKCSFRIIGTGTFQGSEATSPTIGRAGKYETVSEVRLEMIAPASKLGGIVDAIQAAHPYEEPAYDIYALQPRPVRGLGRHGRLQTALSLSDLVSRLKKEVPTQCPQVIGDPGQLVERVAVCVGAASCTPLSLNLGSADCLITGEMRHHHALAIERMGTSAIVLGHWASERPVLAKLSETLQGRLVGVQTAVSQADGDPFRSL